MPGEVDMLKKYFVKQGIREVSIEDFIRENYPSADYSNIELQRTPLGIKVLIYTHKPGRVIGRGGSKINKMSEALKVKFELDNPQLDVKSIDNPNLDSKIVAKQIKTALERGYNYKKIGNMSLKRVMEAGAIGVEIVISGKLGGSKGRIGKFTGGYLKHCGDSAEKLVDYGFEEALTKPGKIGIKVKIMKEFMSITGEIISQKPIKREDARARKFIPKKPAAEEKPVDEIGEETGSLDFDYTEETNGNEEKKGTEEISVDDNTEKPKEEAKEKKAVKKEKAKKEDKSSESSADKDIKEETKDKQVK